MHLNIQYPLTYSQPEISYISYIFTGNILVSTDSIVLA